VAAAQIDRSVVWYLATEVWSRGCKSKRTFRFRTPSRSRTPYCHQVGNPIPVSCDNRCG